MSLQKFLDETIGQNGKPLSGQHVEVNDDRFESIHQGYIADVCQLCGEEFIVGKGQECGDCGGHEGSL